MPRTRRAPSEGSPLEQARALALRVVAFRARTEAQLRARLARAGHEALADDVVGWLSRLGYLDDAAYARGRARTLLRRLGPRAVERRLVSEGVAAPLAREAATEAAEERAAARPPGEAPEVALCRAALRTRLRGAEVDGLDDRGRARLARFLLGRGFSGAAVARVLGPLDAAEW